MQNLSQPTLFDLSKASLFPNSAAVADAIELLATKQSSEARGAIFTRIEVVDFILDLMGYNGSRPLYRQRILEPSFGSGEFLLSIVRRLMDSWRKYSGKIIMAEEELADAIRAVELHRETFESTRGVVIELLVNEGIPAPSAVHLADRWLLQGDFLLTALDNRFDYVAANPPYVRQEQIPPPLLAEYRRRYSTMYDRADLYIPFLERALSLLDQGGILGFICADRWMKNRYGGPLRNFVSQRYHLRAYVDMVGTDAFHSEVSAYPAIVIIGNEKAGATRIAHRPAINRQALGAVAAEILSSKLPAGAKVREMWGVANGAEPWLLESSDQMALIRRVEIQYPSLEQAGCRVGIGVATGADLAFIGDFDSMDVESDRKLPLVATRDIQSGEVVWRGQGVINPFGPDGRLVELRNYPRLARYLDQRRDVIMQRHCAKKSPANWYRTIDRIWPDLLLSPKLLIPDIKGEAHIVFESGMFYPHHNLYYVTSAQWDLRALQAVLLSCVAKLFVTTYSTRMRGGYLRFQAQYLRRIRIPSWLEVSENLRCELIQAATHRDLPACNKAVFKLYKLNRDERAALGGNGE